MPMSVAVIDDKQDNRESLCDELTSTKLSPFPISGAFSSLDSLLKKVVPKANAVVCDQHLSDGNYASFEGTQFMKVCYGKKIPAILQTNWLSADFYKIRRYRRWIPILLKSDEVNSDTILHSIQVCLKELSGVFTSNRRPWRTLLQIEDVSDGIVDVSVVGWDSREIVGLPVDMIEEESIRNAVLNRKVSQLYAQVNQGAEEQSELYFYDFESR